MPVSTCKAPQPQLRERLSATGDRNGTFLTNSLRVVLPCGGLCGVIWDLRKGFSTIVQLLILLAPVLGTIPSFVYCFIFIFPLHIGLVGSYWKPCIMPGSGDTWVRRADCNIGTKGKIAPSGKFGAVRIGVPGGSSEEVAFKLDLCFQSSSLHKF